MHRQWTVAAAVIAMLCMAGAGEARNRPPSRTTEAPPIPYRLDGLSGASASAPAEAAKALPEAASGTRATPQAPATGVIRDGYYYPPPVTVTTVIEHRRR